MKKLGCPDYTASVTVPIRNAANELESDNEHFEIIRNEKSLGMYLPFSVETILNDGVYTRF